MTVPSDILATTLASTLKLEQSSNARLTQALAEAHELLRNLVHAATQADAVLAAALDAARAHLNPGQPVTTQGGDHAR